MRLEDQTENKSVAVWVLLQKSLVYVNWTHLSRLPAAECFCPSFQPAGRLQRQCIHTIAAAALFVVNKIQIWRPSPSETQAVTS